VPPTNIHGMAAGAASDTVARSTGVEPERRPDEGPDRAPHARHPARPCCNLYHRAVELVGRRWTGAILLVMLDGPLRFSEIRGAVPDLSDRLLSERLKELESEGIVERRVLDGAPVRVEYALTDKGRALEPTLRALKSWANDWLC
jgi:DNA-binding HxlR family transcriptional regulator